jgi:hypothetical protein
MNNILYAIVLLIVTVLGFGWKIYDQLDKIIFLLGSEEEDDSKEAN